jgi:hypothetical protein
MGMIVTGFEIGIGLALAFVVLWLAFCVFGSMLPAPGSAPPPKPKRIATKTDQAFAAIVGGLGICWVFCVMTGDLTH